METGSSADAFALEASEDLQNWIPLGGRTLPATFTDPSSAIFPTRYYRAAIIP